MSGPHNAIAEWSCCVWERKRESLKLNKYLAIAILLSLSEFDFNGQNETDGALDGGME